MSDRFGPEVTEYLTRAIEMYAADDADLIFLVMPEQLSSPRVLHELQMMLADHMNVNGKTDRLLIVLPDGVVPYGVAPLDPLRRVDAG